jgi:branched-chain amino acid transport system substrate-binding protein
VSARETIVKRFGWVFVVLVAAGVVAYFLFFSGHKHHAQTVTIAVIGPMSGERQAVGRDMLRAVELGVKPANDRAGERDTYFEVVSYDDGDDPETARRIAEDVAASRTAHVIVGPASSATCAVVAPICARAGVPMVTATVSPVEPNEVPWSFCTSFDDEAQGRFAAVYLRRVLERDKVAIVHADDAHSRALADAFHRPWQSLGGRSAFVLPLTSPTKTPEARLEEVLNEVRTHQAGCLFLAAPPAEAARFVQRLRDRRQNDLVLGSDELATPAFTAWFEAEAPPSADPDHYPNGVLVVSRFLPDLVGVEAYEFLAAFDRAAGKKPDAAAAGFFDCAGLVVHAAHNLDFRAPLSEQRRALRDHLAGIDSPSRTVPGATGACRFNRRGRTQKSIAIGRYLGHKLVPASPQLYALHHADEQPNLQAWLEKGRAVDAAAAADDVTAPFFIKTRVVFAGCRIHKVGNFDPEALTCDLDLLLWFRFEGQDPDDIKKIGFRNAVEPLGLGKPDEEEGAAPGLQYQRYHVKGTFRGDFSPGAYSRDRHTLGISFHNEVLGRDQLVYAPDPIGMDLAAPDGLTRELGAARALELPSPWKLDRASIYEEVVPENSLGRPRRAGATEEFSCLTLNLGVVREPTTLLGRLPLGGALYVSLVCALAVLVLEWRRSRKASAARALGVFVLQGLLLVVFLVTAERALFDTFGDSLQPIQVGRVERYFATAGWLLGGLLFYTVINRFFFIPVEVKTERPIPTVVRRFVIGVLLAVSICGALTFVYDRQLTGILATSGIIAMVIGLSVQMNISNLFAGMAIHFERPFRVGDWILVTPRQGGAIPLGQVIDITWRTTRVRTKDCSVLCIPNSLAAESVVCNYNLPDQVCRSKATVKAGAEQPPERVEKLLVDAALHAAGVLRDPAPKSRICHVADGEAEYELIFYFREIVTESATRRMVLRNVWRHFHNAGIPLATPQRPMPLRRDVVVPAGENGYFGLIRGMEVFRPFPDQALAELSENLPRHEFAAGEVIVEKGESGDSMFVMLEGCVSVVIPGKDGQPLEVTRLGVPDVFGEMALLTGEPRSATVRALTRTVVLEITKDDITPLFEQQPEVMRQLAEIMARRKTAEEQALDKASREQKKAQLSERFFKAISEFFGRRVANAG